MPLTRFAAVPFARTRMVPWTDAGPRRQARRVPKATPIGAHLRQDVPRRNDIDPRNTVELRELRLQRGDQRADLLLERGDRSIQHLAELQQ